MRVKRFIGDSVADTMSKVKRELGSEAVILQTRNIKEGGLFGFFGKTKVEITAAIEDIPQPKWTNPYMKNQAGAESQSITTANDEEPVHKELEQMRRTLDRMTKQMEMIKTAETDKSSLPDSLIKWNELLIKRGISQHLSSRLLEQVKQALNTEDWEDDNKVFYRIESSIRQICSNTGGIRPGIDKPSIVALVGPTGVGKTTTIGKLAAGFSIVDRRRVALITTDTYRVAAVEQLKTFGEIIGVPVEVVMSSEGLVKALEKHSDKELIFLDTAGRSPHHEMHMSELQTFLNHAQPDLTLLVMSATTRTEDQKKIYERFESLATHLAFTKLDETVCAGSLLDILAITKLPTAYLTTGQNVPDDIEFATTERLTRYILGEEKPYA